MAGATQPALIDGLVSQAAGGEALDVSRAAGGSCAAAKGAEEASSVDHSPSLPPSVIIESGRALATDYVPSALEVPSRCPTHLWLIRQRPNIASPSLSHIKAPRGLTIPRSRSLTLTEDDMGFRLNQDQPSRMSTVCLVCV